jgi:hypothetical protein
LGCSYCGEKDKRLVCGSCNSILWYKINGWIPKAAFFAAHRRNLANGVLISAFLATPLTFLYQLMDKKIEAYNFYEQKSLEARDALNRARGLLVSLENLDFAYQSDTAELLQKRIELLDEFQQSYKKASWMAPQVVSYFGWDYHGEKHRLEGIYWLIGSGMKKLSRKNNELFDLNKAWQKMNTKWTNAKKDPEKDPLDFFKMLDNDFQIYMKASNAYYFGIFDDILSQGALDSLKNKRCNAAKIFYKKGQLAGCLLFHISFDNNRTDVSKNKDLDFFGCSCYFTMYDSVWRDNICVIDSLDNSILSDTNPPSLFNCHYGRTVQFSKTLPVSEPEKHRKKTDAPRYQVIAGSFSSEQGADLRVKKLKNIGYSPSMRRLENLGMYRVVAFKTNKSWKAYSVRHILEKEHGIKAIVIDNQTSLRSIDNGFANVQK